VHVCPRSVILVEDDPNARRHLAQAVSALDGAELIGEAGNLRDGLILLGREAPDIVIVDLGLPDGNGIELIRAARQLAADTQCLVVTVFGDQKSVLGAIEAGARGYVLKDASRARIAASLADLLAGGAPIDPAIARHLLLRFQEPAKPTSPQPALSNREIEVLEQVVKGFTYSEIGELLGITTHTVTTHVRRIYRKLEVRSRGEAVFEALQLGIIDLAE